MIAVRVIQTRVMLVQWRSAVAFDSGAFVSRGGTSVRIASPERLAGDCEVEVTLCGTAQALDWATGQSSPLGVTASR